MWFIVCRDVTSGEEHVFRPSTGGCNNFEEFLAYANGVDCWVGHYILGYDVPVLDRLCPGWAVDKRFIDTLVVSRLLDTGIDGGHSLEAWCDRLGVKKKHTDITDWSAPTEQMLERCISDTEGNVLLYKKILKYISSPLWAKAIEVEHFIARRCQELHENGFHFSLDKAKSLWYNIDQQVKELDTEIFTAFPPKVSFVRGIEPKLTKHGTLNRSDFRWVLDGNLSDFNGGPFSRIEYEDFNPGSPVQIVERLNEAGWLPTEKTKGHSLAIREKKDLERKGLWSKEKQERLDKFGVYGYTVSEENLLTLPETAPPAAKTLARRIMLASRLRTLTEWINAYNHETHRVHGSFSGIGAWTHRMSHSNPNTGNIAREDALYGAEMRSMWCTPERSFLVGVDAESIQLRVLAHYINDPKFTESLLTGKKEDGTDPHSLNKIALGPICASRNDAKTFIYAWLLGAGIGKVAQILGCTYGEASEAVDNFIEFYPGLKHVKEVLIPEDAKRGYFQGFDGRWVKIFGEDFSSKKHFCLAGYLQNGEVCVMKHGMQIWYPRLKEEGVPFKIVNFVHDEWQTEVPDYDTGKYVGEVQAEGIRLAGELLNLRCPMAGSVLNGHGQLAIGPNWLSTH